MKYISLLFILNFSVSFAQNLTSEDSLLATKYLYSAFSKYEKKDLVGAVKLLNEAINKYPEFEDFFILRADCNQNLGKFEDAQKDAQKAILLNASNPHSFELLAVSEIQLTLFQEAIDHLSIAEKMDSLNSTLNYYKSYCFKASMQFQEALNEILKAIQKSPNDTSYFLEKAEILSFLGKDNEAIGILNNLILEGKNVNDVSLAKYMRGKILFKIGDSKGALEDFLICVELMPSKKDTPRYIANIFAQDNDSAHAEYYFQMAFKKDPGNADLMLDYATFKKEFNDCNTAKYIFDSYFEIIPKEKINPLVYSMEAQTIGCLGDTTAALMSYEKSLQIIPETEKIKIYLDRLNFLYFNRNYISVLSSDLQKAIEIYSKSNSFELANILQFSSLLNLLNNDTIQSENDLINALNVSKEKHIAYYNLAAHYYFFRNNEFDYKKIIDYLTKSIETNDKIADSYLLLAYVYCTFDSKNGFKLAENVLQKAQSNCKESEIDISRIKRTLADVKALKKNQKIKMEVTPYIYGKSPSLDIILNHHEHMNYSELKFYFKL